MAAITCRRSGGLGDLRMHTLQINFGHGRFENKARVFESFAYRETKHFNALSFLRENGF